MYFCRGIEKPVIMGIEDKLILSLQSALSELFELEVSVTELSLQPTKKDFEGDYTFVTFPFAGKAKSNPFQLAEKLGAYLVENLEEVDAFNVVKGFLNLELGKSSWLTSFYSLPTDQQSFQFDKKDEKVMVEYSSPNTNKPLHLGHLRNNFLGYSISQILSYVGYDLTKANLINDRGIHICKSMIAYKKFGDNETPESSGLKGDHLIGKYYVRFDKEYRAEIAVLVAGGMEADEAKLKAPLMIETQEMLLAWENNDSEVRELWEKLNSWVYKGFESTYKSIGVKFDTYYYESNTYLLGKEIVTEGLSKEVFFKKEDGSVWVDLSAEGLDEKLVLRGDGTSVYITQDMGTADLKYEDYTIDKSIYVVGNEQDYHFDVLKKILTKLERPYAPGIYHMSYGMVDLPSGKMKSREGTVVDADDLISDMISTAKGRTDELGKIDSFTEDEATALYQNLALGALKYFILKVDPKRRMLFNPEESIDFQGNTGPFIQYTHARISAIVRRANELGIDLSAQVTDYTISDVEASLIQLLLATKSKIEESARAYAPSIIANHVFDIARLFNRFYAEFPIFKEDNEESVKFRVQFCSKVAKHIDILMSLLGVVVPERM